MGVLLTITKNLVLNRGATRQISQRALATINYSKHSYLPEEKHSSANPSVLVPLLAPDHIFIPDTKLICRCNRR